ncbi:MAG: hypothetical protein MJ025_03405 [Victivallaceae bacterium]|nr:hypothetical protein [Victivallaceae bacterium]
MGNVFTASGLEIELAGLWDFGYSATNEIPDCDTVVVVPACADALLERFSREGYASFRKKVSIGGEVRLRVTAGLRSRVFWDGREIGRSCLAYTREEYDFDAGEEGEHTLLIVTDNFRDDSKSSVFRPYYDFYGYNGIYDTVTIERLVPGKIDRIQVTPLAKKPGTVRISLHAVPPAPEILEISFDGKTTTVYPWSKTLTIPVPKWKYWSPEHPNLHTVTINGTMATFGIRFLDWSGRRLLLNGKPVKLLGVNRHEAHPEFGPATPESLIWNDLVAIKRKGFNFIRGSHYPQRDIMLDIADRLGLLVWEEALGWGNIEESMTDAVFGDRQEEQCRKMVRKSFNHPSVIIWGFLNECQSDLESSRPLTTRLRDTLHKLDGSRPVSFATYKNQDDKCIRDMDVVSINTYPDWYDDNLTTGDMSAIGRRLQALVEIFPEKPIIITEIGCAALYGDHSGLRWSEEYQADYASTVIREIKARDDFSGASLWQYCDMRTCATTKKLLGTPRCFNNKGLVNEYRLPKLAWKAVEKALKK